MVSGEAASTIVQVVASLFSVARAGAIALTEAAANGRLVIESLPSWA